MCHTSSIIVHVCVYVRVCVFPLVTCLLGNYVDKHRFIDQLRLRRLNIIKGGSVLTVVEKIDLLASVLRIGWRRARVYEGRLGGRLP